MGRDVYKRQLETLPKSFRISGRHLINGLLGKAVHERGKLYLCLRNIFPVGIEIPPVSYTHLDVYKRQALHRGIQR